MKKIKEGFFMESENKAFYLREGFQVLFMIVMLGLFGWRIFHEMKTVVIEDEGPRCFSYEKMPQDLSDNAPTVVEAGLYIKQFLTFDVQNSNFEMEGNVWFLFDPQQISLETLEKFSFAYNTDLQKSAPLVQELDGKTFALFPIHLKFTSPLRHHLFPLGDHRIFLALDLANVKSSNVHLQTNIDGFQLNEGGNYMGWKPEGLAAKDGYNKDSLSLSDPRRSIDYPRALFSIDFHKPGPRVVLVILLPNLLFLFLGLLALLPKNEHATRMTIAVGSLSGLMLSRYSVENLAPRVSYFTVVDYVYLFALFSSLIVLFLSFHKMSPERTQFLDTAAFYTLQVLAFIMFMAVTA